MRILVIGGTSFVGRHIVGSAIDAGHEVTLFNRGKTDPGGFPEAEHLVGDRDDDLSALDGGSWDATVDVCAYVPRQVRTLLDTLGERSGHYTLVSTISVYAEVQAGFDESAPLLEPAWDDEPAMHKYGELKVGCERVARQLAGDRLLVVRPGFVFGPHDPTHRFTYWVERVADGRSPMAGPDAEQPLQGVDVRDLATFTTSLVGDHVVGTFHVTAPDEPPTFQGVLETVADALDRPLPDIRWMGARHELPLSAPRSSWPKLHASPTNAREAGFSARPLADTARATYEWVSRARADGSYTPRPGVGLSPADETALLTG